MKEEKRKSNVIEAPTMFVGVGGTGSKIVKQVYDLCTKEERENISFVCMDTNVNDLNDLRRGCKEIITIQTSNTQTVGSYLDTDDDASKHWFPKNAVIFDKTVSEGAGQLRAISRLALNATIKTGKIAPLFDAVDSLFKKNGQAMKQALRICVVSTASGGTGSGMTLPFCMFLRDYVNNKYPNASVILRTLILLPETLDQVIKSNIERDSQRRNAYATIKEINAFMMKGSGFCDIEKSLARYKDIHVDITEPGKNSIKSLSILPCDFCFLLDGQDAEDATSNTFKQYQAQAALALYEQNIGPMQKQAFSVEDNIIKELSNPGNFGRNRFGGIGAGRIIYPYEDVADYIAYNWAKDSIGGSGEASKWLLYDKKARESAAEDEKQGRSIDESTPYEKVYIDALDASETTFSKNLKNHYRLNDSKEKIDQFFKDFIDAITKEVNNNPKIEEAQNSFVKFKGANPYENSENWSNAGTDYANLANYAGLLEDVAVKVSKNTSEGILRNDEKTLKISQTGKFLESILRTQNYICHPCAARYMLYKVYLETKERLEKADTAIREFKKKIGNITSPWAEDTVTIKRGREVKEIQSLSELCGTVSSLDPSSKKDKKAAGDAIDKMNLMKTLYTYNDKYKNAIIEYNALVSLFAYVSEINKQYEKFFNTFGENVKRIENDQRDIIDRLKYKKGDSIRNVCADEAMLEELSRSTKKQMEKGQMLDDELNADIFDQVKRNANLTREYQLEGDIIETDERKDIFRGTLMDYFKRVVRTECTDIDMNIIQAIGKEKKLQEVAKVRESHTSDSVDPEAVSNKELVAHIKSVIAEGQNISAPGIQRMVSEESREINVCAYNTELKNMREYRIDELIPNAAAVDTVPKYELHYFNALYNLTPDKLKKFAAPKVTETGRKPAGLYHNAYTTYTKDIGPDCLKSSKMTTHIDRRWDSIAALPEIDLDYQQKQFLRTHKALIYGLIFECIVKEPYVDGNSKLESPALAYRYKNTKGFIEDMIVTNGTLCDEFYEILDSLYIDRAIVEDIYNHERHETARDIMSKVDYYNTTFSKNVQKFQIERENGLSGNTASIFEVPLEYYSSLPSRLRDDAELACLVDAVIEIFDEQIKKYESEKNARFILCDQLRNQWDLLCKNYEADNEIKKGVELADNKLIDVIERKLREVYLASPQPENYESVIEEMDKQMGNI